MTLGIFQIGTIQHCGTFYYAGELIGAISIGIIAVGCFVRYSYGVECASCFNLIPSAPLFLNTYVIEN